MKKIATLAVVAAGLLAVPAAASAAPPHLSAGEAARVIGSQLHRTFEYGATPGSLNAKCYYRKRNMRICWVEFYDRDGDYWCGNVTVVETRRYYRFVDDHLYYDSICD